MRLCAENDGKLFINVYSQAETKLGQDLSNFAHKPFIHPKYGSFNSVEGAWYWYFTGKMHDNLRLLSGGAAKSAGVKLVPSEWRNEEIIISDAFKKFINECTQCKLRTHKDLLMDLISTDLPLEHFYVKGSMITNKNKYKWILDEIVRIRKVTQEWYIKKHGKLPTIKNK